MNCCFPIMTWARIALLVYAFSIPTTIAAQTASRQNPSFTDVIQSSGLLLGSPRRSLKFGGPFVADLDRDGVYDVILNFHNRNLTRIYMGNGDGTFKLFVDPRTGLPFRPNVFDVHGISVAQLTTTSPDRIISFSVGGGRGTSPRSAEIYLMTPRRDFIDVSKARGLGRIRSRPRNTMFMDLQLSNRQRRRRNGGGPDALFVNFLIPPKGVRNVFTQFAYRNFRGFYSPVRRLGDFSSELRGRTALTDIDGNGVMEVISIQDLTFYELRGPFFFRDITSSVLPFSLKYASLTASAVAELDYDNDGDYDLYVARANRVLLTQLGRVPGDDRTDFLLRNEGGYYSDATSSAGIPGGTNSMGVTVGDFNNDGFVDVLVILYAEPDMILMNQGNGKFRRVNGLIPKRKGDVGNHAVAVDYNLDGRVDAIVGHGREAKKIGPYLLMKNTMSLTNKNHYLLVTVFNDPTRSSTSLHAVVTVFLKGGRRIVRRVGSRGAQAGGDSYLDTVHFGLGTQRMAVQVQVVWTSSARQTRKNVPADKQVFFGVR